jgi:hypothetical protein
LLVSTFIQSIYNFIPQTNHAFRVRSVAAILYLQFMIQLLLLLLLLLLFTIICLRHLIFHWTEIYFDVNSFLLLKGYRNTVTKMNTHSIRYMALLTQCLSVKTVQAHCRDTVSACEDKQHQAHGPADTVSACEDSTRHMALLTQCLSVKTVQAHCRDTVSACEDK